MFDSLRIAERRLSSINIHQPDSGEAVRFKMVVEDLKGRLTAEQLTEYETSKNAVPTLAERKAAAAKELKQMEQNRDSVSI